MIKIKGKIISISGIKTKNVQIMRESHHPIYLKRLKKYTKVKAHDEKNQYEIGDTVEIASSKPQSKSKNWIILRKI